MKILSAKQYGVALKATIQNTGRLGFSGPTAGVLELATRSHVCFAQDDDADGTLYLAVMPEPNPDAFKIMQSGGYYNVNTTQLFEALKVDYKSRMVIYDLKRAEEKDEELGGAAYRMEPRYLPRREADEGTE